MPKHIMATSTIKRKMVVVNTITDNFSHNQTNKQYVITLPEFSNICKVTIELNHVQGFYGRFVELYISKHGNTYMGVIEKINKSNSTSYNDFTYSVSDIYATRTITLSITTGSALSHDLRVVMEFE